MFTSSIGKKVWMAVFGLFLCVFLLVHMGINLLLLCEDRSYFDAGVAFMSSGPIKVMEVVLFGGFLLHALLGIVLQVKNWKARPVGYAKKYNSQTSFFSKYMIWTGGIIILFLVLHLFQFYFVKMGWCGQTPEALGIQAVPETGTEANHNFYDVARLVFGSTLYSVIYLVFMVLLGFHLVHAFQSAFQSIGWNHPTYTPIIKCVGYIYAVIVPVGFAIIPLYFLLGGK